MPTGTEAFGMEPRGFSRGNTVEQTWVTALGFNRIRAVVIVGVGRFDFADGSGEPLVLQFSQKVPELY